MRLTRRLERASEILLIILVVGTPLAFGSVEVWATELMKLGILLFVLLRVASHLTVRPAAPPVPITATGLVLPAILFVGLVGLQVLPLPGAVIRVLSPRTDAMYRQTLPGYPGRQDFSRLEGNLLGDPGAAPFAVAGEGASAPRPATLRTVSTDPGATRERLSLLIAHLALFFAAVEYARDPARRLRLMMAIALTGFGIAAFALIQKMTWNGKIYWIRVVRQGGQPFGPFVNPNEFCAYVELTLPIAVGLLLMVWKLRSDAGEAPPEDLGSGLIAFARRDEAETGLFAGWREAALSKTAVVGCATLVTLLAIVASGSRGGLVTTAAVFAIFAGMLAPRAYRRRAIAGMALLALAAITLVVLGSFGIGPLGGFFTRLSNIGAEPTFADRWITWGYVLRMIPAYPLLGTGLGTFAGAYASYYPAGVFHLWDKAHNDYLQLIVEAGITGGLLLLLGLIGYGRRIFIPALAPGPGRPLRLGLSMALVAMALHSFVDFNLQIPANGMLTVLIGGLLAGTVLAGDGVDEGQEAEAEAEE